MGWLALETGDTAGWGIAGLGLCAVLAVAVSLRWPSALGVALALLGGTYALTLAVAAPAVDPRAAAVSATLVLVAGLVDWTYELRTTSPDEPGTQWRRAMWIATGGIIAFATAESVLALADIAAGGGIVLDAIGAVAAVAVVAIVLVLALDSGRNASP